VRKTQVKPLPLLFDLMRNFDGYGALARYLRSIKEVSC
jgi:hypothetical protein